MILFEESHKPGGERLTEIAVHGKVLITHGPAYESWLSPSREPGA